MLWNNVFLRQVLEHFFDDSFLTFSLIAFECQNEKKLVKFPQELRIFGVVDKIIHSWGKIFEFLIDL